MKHLSLSIRRWWTAGLFWLLTFPATQAQTILKGLVQGDDNRPLPGVSVAIKGTTSGTTSDANGAFQLKVPDRSAVLVFSFIGYTTKEIPIGNQTTLTVTLSPDLQQLNEVVVVGYGTQRKSDLTGSISSISERELRKVAIASVDQGLQGRAAGVQVTSANGQPGAGSTIRIRGGNSITGGNEPLYVVDGFPISSIPSGGALQGPALNPLATINPNEITSIEVLKDASATAIYGARAANGVVLITTKRGKADQNSISVESYYGVQQVRKLIPMLNARDYAVLANESEFNAGNGANVRYKEEEIAALGAGTNWQEAMFRDAPIQNYTLSASGGTARTQYFLSANYFRQDGIMLNSDLSRGSFRLNLDTKLTDRLKVGNTLTISNTASHIVNNDESVTGVTYAALAFNPITPVYNPDGSYVLASPPFNTISNPVALAREVTNTSSIFRGLGNLYAEYEILTGLKARISVGGDVAFVKEDYYAPRTVRAGIDAIAGNGLARIANAQTKTWLNENTLTYDRTFNQKHTFNALLGYTTQTSNSSNTRAIARGFPNDILLYNNLGAAQTPLMPASGYSDWKIVSYLGRINYNLNGKYLVTLTSRVDGSSRFGSGNKYGFFPSGSVAWRLAEEDFIKKINFFTDLKLRLSYGVTGNQDIAPYQSLSSSGSVRYVLGDALTTGFAPNQIANPNLKWESTYQSDIGLDVSVLNGRINLTADAYYKKTRNLLLNVNIPWSSGFASSLKNIGSVENKGVELSISSENLTGALKWNTSLNYALNRNKVLDLGGVDFIINGATTGLASGFSVLKVGEPIGAFYGYQFEGLYQTQEELKGAPSGATALLGYMRYTDLNQDRKLDGLDRTIIGSAQPKFIAGLTNNFSYKGLELSVFLQGSFGNDVLYLHRIDLESMKAVNNGSAASLARWTGPGTSDYIPRAYRQVPREPVSTRLVEDGSFLRCRNITLGYSLPADWLTKSRLKTARVYASAQNLFTVTSYSGYDPEVSAFGQSNLTPGVDLSTYPSSKMYLLGLNFSF